MNHPYGLNELGEVVDVRTNLSYGFPGVVGKGKTYAAEDMARQMNRAYEAGYRAAQKAIKAALND